MEKRAVQVSHELWKQSMTQGQTSAGVRCIEGIPEDAEFVAAFAREESFFKDASGETKMRSDPVFVFESDDWAHPASEHAYRAPWGEEFPLFTPVFRIAECRTCKQWNKEAFFHGDEGWRGCSKAPEQIRQKGDNVQAVSINDEGDWAALETAPSFGCTAYEPRETDD